MDKPASSGRPCVWVVDDTPDNLYLMAALLEDRRPRAAKWRRAPTCWRPWPVARCPT